ncbi:FkbM family methyltransferase [Stutzerimonas kunmingensis]|uniref:FkbM family methyltransferase n=1 Tax=Stutzerimonas kunmingensis TaxID=1211807 RepID=UPI002898449C|nr:FkbM family methyltransferase [Stutzerimonas kunmingensis]
MKCCVIIPVGPGHQELAKRASSSVEQAIEYSKGAFDEIEILELDDSEGKLGRSHARNLAIRQAELKEADWLFFLDADDFMVPTAFSIVAEMLDDFDAIWGEIYTADITTLQAYRRDNQISPITQLEQILINDPYLTLQMGHFVRHNLAKQFPFNVDMDCGEDFDYYLRLWKDKRCIKIEHPLFLNVRGQHSNGPRSASGRDWRIAVNKTFQLFCQENEVIARVPYGNQEVKFRLSNTLDTIQNHLARDCFFEIRELNECLLSLPQKSRILDIGSNIGNHALFFTCIGDASEVHCFEPIPSTADQLELNFQINKIPSERYKIYRIGLGSKLGKAKPGIIDNSNLGATSLTSDSTGKVKISSLDHLYPTKVFDFIKIDVEGMELDVLKGGSKLIERCQPVILIEIANSNKSAFFAWTSKNNYRIHRAFELVHASNYLITPKKQREDFYKNGLAGTIDWTPKITLAPGQPEPGWSIIEFIENYENEREIIELSLSGENYFASNIRNQNTQKSLNNLKELSDNYSGDIIFLNEILGLLTDEKLKQLLSTLAGLALEIILLDIMDARWERSFNSQKKYRDTEQYLQYAGALGYSLIHYQKLPHKSAFGIHEQLDNQITLLHLKKNTNATGLQ